MYIYIYIHIRISIYIYMCVIICQLPVGSLVVAVDKEIGELLPGHSKIFPTIPCGP